MSAINSAHGPKKDVNNQTWEQSDFPVVCETCLGDNPYLRMTKDPYGKECKICTRPFTIFRWKPGPKARFKKTEVCQTCAKVKNVCQTCLLDLEYGLPVQVRDSAMPSNEREIPESDVHREYFADIHQRELEGKTEWSGKAPPSVMLSRLARTAPYYKRNAPRVCSFWVKGTCTRGAACPYRHEEGPSDPDLAKQNFKDRYYGRDDPVANKMMNQFGKFKPLPPQDRNITTVFVSGLSPQVTEPDLRDQFYSFGEITTLQIVHKSQCAFVTYSTREAAENAVDKLHGNLSVKGFPLRVGWARSAFGAAGSQKTQYPPTQPVSGGRGTAPALGAPASGPAVAGPGSNFFSLPNPPPVPPPVMGGYGQVAYYPSMDPAMHGSRAADGPPQARK